MLCLLIALLMTPVLHQAPPNSAPISTQKNGDKPTGQTQNQIANPTPAAAVSGTSESQQTSSDKKQQGDESYEKWLYHSYEWATIIGVVGGWVVLLIVWRQSQAVINAERAWVMVHLKEPAANSGSFRLTIRVDAYQGDNQTTRSTTSVMVLGVAQNQGKTPAWIYEWKIRGEIVDRDRIPPKPDFTIRDFTSYKDSRPAPVGVDIFLALPCSIYGRCSDTQVIVVYGVVMYRDIFGKKRETQFGYGIWGETMLMALDSPDYHKTT